MGPGAFLDAREHLLAIARVPDRGGREGDEVLHALVLGDPQRVDDHLGQPRLAGLRQVAVRVKVRGERQVEPAGEGRERTRTRMGIDDQHVHGVRADVEYPKSHNS